MNQYDNRTKTTKERTLVINGREKVPKDRIKLEKLESKRKRERRLPRRR
jgi:hypothetical protein